MHITNYKCALVLCQFHFCQRLLLIFLHSSYQMFHINFPPTSFDANFLVSFQKIYAAFHKRVRTFKKIVYYTKSPNIITWSQGHHSRFLADMTVIVAARQLGVPLLTSLIRKFQARPRSWQSCSGPWSHSVLRVALMFSTVGSLSQLSDQFSLYGIRGCVIMKSKLLVELF